MAPSRRGPPPQIAGVILEPVVGNSGFIVPTKEFLEGLREITKAEGALLCFDEVRARRQGSGWGGKTLGGRGAGRGLRAAGSHQGRGRAAVPDEVRALGAPGERGVNRGEGASGG